MIIYLKRLKSSKFVRVKAFPMYDGIGVSAPISLHNYYRSLPRSSAHALELSAKIRMREIELVTRKWRRILRKLPDLSKSPSERYKLSVCIKGSCTTCIQAALDNFYGL